MPISEIELHKAEWTLRNYCERRTNPAVRNELEIVFRLEGNFAYIAERRPGWLDMSIVRDHDVAKFRSIVKQRTRVLLLARSESEVAQVPECEPAADIAELLPVVDTEPIFYG